MKKIPGSLFIALACLTLGSAPSLAAIWSSTSASFLYGEGYQLASSENATIITIEHASVWKYGDNFLFFDIFQPFDLDTGIYGEWHPRFSLGKMAGKDMSFAFIKDVLIATELNVAQEWRAYLYGIGFDLDIPHFNFFAINFFIRDDMTINDDTTWQISPNWNVPFTIGAAHFEFGGFLDYTGAEGDGKYQILTQPQLLLDVSNFSGKPGNFYAGIEYQYFKNKYGVDGLDDNLVQLMGKWVF